MGTLVESLRFKRIDGGDFDDAEFDDFLLSLVMKNPLPGDASGDGSLDLLDLEIPRSNFGVTASALLVLEPSAAALLVCWAAACWYRKR